MQKVGHIKDKNQTKFMIVFFKQIMILFDYKLAFLISK